MLPELRTALDQLLRHESLSGDVMQAAIGAIMDGRCGEAETAALLTALALSGETEDELAGAAAAMRARATRIPTGRTGLLDTCGTGGDKLHTFNISTATALVVAATGVPVAKHGNRSVSSSSGSADVLEALGVNISLTAEQAGRCLDELGICFCFARIFHSAMQHVAPVRQQLGFRTIFNLLGPLTNPARAEYQLLGASSNAHAEKLAKAVARLGLMRAIVVCGNNQLDEVSLWGTTQVWDVKGREVQPLSWTPADFKLPECRVEELQVASVAQSADVIRGILSGETSAARDIVLANAAAALYCRGVAGELLEGVELAAQALDNGAAEKLLQRLSAWTGEFR